MLVHKKNPLTEGPEGKLQLTHELLSLSHSVLFAFQIS